MGYNTKYKLSTDANYNATEEAFVDALEKIADYGRMQELLSYGMERKWYGHEDDMKALSLQFPETIFNLSGDGEESGDTWRKYFKNGKMQYCEAQITYAAFDEEKLK